MGAEPADDPADPTGPARSASRALLVSVWASAAFAVVSLCWGLAVGSQLIVFDGLYSFAAVGLSLLAVQALRTSRKGPDERYPWGRQVWEPLTIVAKATALAALCLYALVDAVLVLLDGGRDIDTGWAVGYGAVAPAGGLAVTIYLRRRRGPGSDLVRAEAAEWAGDTLLSLGVLAGFVLALVLEATGHADLARYVDPVLVIVISAAFLWVPARLIGQGFREVLTMSPDPSIQQRLLACVHEIEQEYGFTEAFLRASKVGGRLDIEIDYVVDERSGAQTVHEFDEVRAQLRDRLPVAGYTASMTVSFTADRRWAL
jgi:cation diffusion facilitator family transporter